MKVNVSATSANLACGFDSFGISLDLYNTFSFLPLDENEIIINNYHNTEKNKTNLIASSFYKGLEFLGKEPFGIEISNVSQVPLSRGLGSSATCIVASLVAAYALTNTPLDKEELLQFAASIEGHADNVAPAIFGGGVISYKTDKVYKHTSFDINEKYHFAAIIPNFSLSTSKARAALPNMYERNDAVFNLSRAAILPLAFERGDDGLLLDALDDKIHQPYRRGLIKNFDKVEEIAKKSGYISSYLSGAGPTTMAVGNSSSDFNLLCDNISKMDKRYSVIKMEITKEAVSIF